MNQTPYPPEMLRGLKQIFCAPEPRDPIETETELCLSVSCRGMGQQWTATGAGALGATDLGMAKFSRLGYGINSLGEGHL